MHIYIGTDYAMLCSFVPRRPLPHSFGRQSHFPLWCLDSLTSASMSLETDSITRGRSRVGLDKFPKLKAQCLREFWIHQRLKTILQTTSESSSLSRSPLGHDHFSHPVSAMTFPSSCSCRQHKLLPLKQASNLRPRSFDRQHWAFWFTVWPTS